MAELRKDLLKQAERAERLADQATDDEIIHTLRHAARDYRTAAERRQAEQDVRPEPSALQ